jgi:hypothetical protein
MKVDMMPRSQGREGTASDAGNFRAEMDFNVGSGMPSTQLARRKVGGCMRISVSNPDVSEHRLNKVMIASVVPWE